MEQNEETAKKAGRPRGSGTKSLFAYKALLDHFPRPGGEGAHHAFFKIGALGYKAGVAEKQIVADVKSVLQPGGRHVSDEEIEQGVGRGFETALGEELGFRKPDKRSLAKVPPDAFAKIVAANKGVTVEDIMRKSPVPLDFPEWEAGWRTIDALYSPRDLLFIGVDRSVCSLGSEIRHAGEWVEEFRKGAPEHPLIIPNPLTGVPAPKKDGSGETLRGDNNVAVFRHIVLEMDSASLEEQLAFWSYAALPVRALVMSGGKSIHGWVDVDCADREEWEREVENDLFPGYLTPLGADPLCRNESRLSRMPGHVRRDDKVDGVVQRLIWLSPEGKAVCE